MNPEEKQQLQDLIEWKRKQELQQLKFPIDQNSEDVLRNRGFLLFQNQSSSTVVATKSIKVNVAGQDYQINVL